MINKKPLTDEQKEAINNLMHEFRYDYEGARDTDSIESWVDEWMERES